ncbi:MAG: winged helix-turn-helix transcriptional regulator [Thermoplasmata archaeon]
MDALELETRRRIYQTILKNPGIHIREIQRKTGLAIGVLTYNLEVLENTGYLRSELKDGKKYYFPYTFPYSDSRMLMFMREPTPRKILLLLLQHPCTFNELLQNVGKSRGVVYTHISRMVKEGVVGQKQSENGTLYYVCLPEKVKSIFLTYRESFYDGALERFIELWSGV